MAFFGALALSAALVWLSIAIAHRYDIVDHPDGGRKVQAYAIPKLGGVAIAIAFSASALLVLSRGDEPVVLEEALGILLPAIAAAAIGYVDDKRGLSPAIRLLLQGLVGLSIAFALRNTVMITDNQWINGVIVILWVMALINGVNLLDNSDGLAGATVLVSALIASAVAAACGQILIALLGFALAGTAAGFLVYNWNPARVYMGDSGAYFLGTLLAALTLQLKVAYADVPVTLLIPILVAALPLLDTTFVIVSRMRRGIHPFTAGRDHLSHRLQGAGMSVRSSVFTLEAIMLAAGIGAFALTLVYR
ncbi:MAG: MraY family glycosyltransferase [Actinomycetota bacterium]|nr:MraY family glycosyltransferase [Actinomycetota bacterium]